MTLTGTSQEDERKRTTVEAFEIKLDDVETEGCGPLGTTWRRDPISAPYRIRREGGVSLTSGVYVEHENPALDILRHGHR